MARGDLYKATKQELQVHIFGTYISLRVGMGLVAAAFPLVLWLSGRLNGIPLQTSMSAYYWATPQGLPGEAPVRIWFVGGLFALAACLYLYKGFTDDENWALNIASILALAVAYFPTCRGSCPRITLHGVVAVSAFVFLAYVTLFRSGDTLPFLKKPALEARYQVWYRITSAAMLLSPVTAAILWAASQKERSYTFFLEWAGIWAFAAFWFIKSHEMRVSSAELKALRQELGT